MRSSADTLTLVCGVFPFSRKPSTTIDAAPAVVAPVPSADVLAKAHATLETTIHALALELSRASDALNAAADHLRDGGHGRQAQAAKHAANHARAMAHGWVP